MPLKKIQESPQFKSYEDMCKNSKPFKQGLKDFKEGNLKNVLPGSVESFWVKKPVQVKQWNDIYKHDSTYCFLKKTPEGIWIGFLVANLIPQECEALTDEELLQVDDYRRMYNIYPRPLEDVKKEENKPQESQPEDVEIVEKDVWNKEVF